VQEALHAAISWLLLCSRWNSASEPLWAEREKQLLMPSSSAETMPFEIKPTEQPSVLLEEVCAGNPAGIPKIVHPDMFVDQEGSTPRATGHEGAKKQPARLQGAKYLAINVFLAFHISAIAAWCMPIDSPLIPLCKNLVRPYFLWSELFQSWDMFAPTPKAANTYVEAIVVYKDDSRKTWRFPRMEQLGLTARCFKERYRELAENLQQDENNALLPDVARHIARLNRSPAIAVRMVVLIQKWSFIVPRTDGSNVPEPWEQQVLLGYGVQPEDFRCRWDLPLGPGMSSSLQNNRPHRSSCFGSCTVKWLSPLSDCSENCYDQTG